MLRRTTLLPDELMHEIFVKLPLKTLLQLKCVCKSWKTLISDPQFARYQFLTSMSDPIMAHQRLTFFADGNRSQAVTCSVQSLVETPSIPAETVQFTVKLDRNYEIIGSCNGLLCLYGLNACFRLWNPFTRLKSKRSPQPRGFPGGIIKHCGFGYDRVNDKYKVMALVRVNEKTVAKVYTFGETSPWRTIHEDIQCSLSFDVYGQFVSGNLHWLTAEVADNGRVILSVDVESESFGQVLLPRELDAHKDLSLHRSGDCLYVCQIFHDRWVLWLMKEYGVQESWTKFTTIPLQESAVTRCALLFIPLCILEDGVVLMSTTCSHSHLVIRYDSSDGTFCRCKISQDQHGKYAQVYHESLVPPPRQIRLDLDI